MSTRKRAKDPAMPRVFSYVPARFTWLIMGLMILFLSGHAAAQTQHGAAPADQPVVIPLPRPDADSGASDEDVDQELFPQSVESDRFLRIATGPIRGGYYAVGGVICELINANLAEHRMECLVRPTSGSGENISHVLGGGAEMGLVQSDWQSFAVTSAGQSTDSSLNFDRLRSVAALYPLALQLVVKGGAGISDLADLDGQRIGLPMDGSGQRQLADVILAQAGISSRNLQTRELANDADMARALCTDEIDAFILVGPAPLQPIDVAITRCGAQLLSIDASVIETVIGDREALTRLTLDSRSYSDQVNQVNTLGFVVTLVASAGLDDRMAAEVARHLVEEVESYSQAHPVLASVRGNGFFTRGLTAPVHNGVARYLDLLATDLQETTQGDVGGDTVVEEQ